MNETATKCALAAPIVFLSILALKINFLKNLTNPNQAASKQTKFQSTGSATIPAAQQASKLGTPPPLNLTSLPSPLPEHNNSYKRLNLNFSIPKRLTTPPCWKYLRQLYT